MEFIRFIFSNFWIWMGFFLLVNGALSGIVQAIRYCQKNGRKIKVCRLAGDKWTIEIENATEVDVVTALKIYEMQPQNREGEQNET